MVYWHCEANGCADGLAKRGKESKHAVWNIIVAHPFFFVGGGGGGDKKEKSVLIKPLCVQ